MVIDRKAYLSIKDYVLIPLRGESQEQKQTQIKQRILDFYNSMLPTIVCIRELSYDSDEIWWPYHWTDVIDTLSGMVSNSVTYITDWNIGEDTYKHFIPKDYDGQILKRGCHASLLLELTKTLIQSDDMCDIWNYGTSGYIFPKNWKQKFISYTTKNTICLDDIKDFYDNMMFTFWMGGEIDIMYLLCHKYDMYRVEEILSEANSKYFYL